MTELRFRVLGPLAVVPDPGPPLVLGTPKQRAVLALLIVRGNRMVTLDELVDEVWPKRPPASAVANVRTYAANLRRLLGDGSESRLSAQGSGYLLTVRDGELDLARFDHAVRLGRTALAAGQHATAAGHLGAAVALWRGLPLADVPTGPALAATCTALEEQRTAAVEAYAEARLGLGEGAAVLPMLYDHVRAQPLRERGHELLMRARYQAGDVAGALATYAEARAVLVEQLGVEPGPRLRRTQATILRGDTAEPYPVVGESPEPRIPRELPADLGSFTGRERELAQLQAALAGHPGRPPARRGRPTIISVYGPGGAGKSALIVHFAHLVADRFPDGQLYVDLNGSTPGLAPKSAYEALVGCLRSIGEPSDRIPTDRADAAARLRTATAGRRLLLVLDNAVDAEQVVPLLPADPAGAVLVTSREMPATLDADVYLRLGGLAPADAAALLHRLAGARPAGVPDAERIARYCDHLPLALRIAGARLAARSDLTAAALADRLSDERRRLDELGIGSLAVRSSLELSYQALTDDGVAAAAFRLLGVVRVPEVEAGLVAAALRLPDLEAGHRALGRLTEAQLLEPAPQGGHYHLHDLVRLAAAGYAERDEPEATRRDWWHRAVLYYLASARRADDLLRPGRRRAVVAGGAGLPAPPDLRPAELNTPADAVTWFDAELRTLLAVAEQTCELPGEDGLFALRLAEAVCWTLGKRGEFHTELRLAELAWRAARARGTETDHAAAHTLVGRALLHLRRLTAASERLGESLAIRRRLGAAYDVVGTLMDLALVHEFAHDYDAAVASLRECLDAARQAGHRLLAAVVLSNLGGAYIELDHWSEALACLEESLPIRRELGDRAGEASTLAVLAQIRVHQGSLDLALAVLDEGVSACRESGNRVDEWLTVTLRSEVNLRLDRVADAIEDAYAAATLAAVGDDPYPRAASMRQLAKALRAGGAEADAVEFARHATTLFEAGPPVRSHALERLLTQA